MKKITTSLSLILFRDYDATGSSSEHTRAYIARTHICICNAREKFLTVNIYFISANVRICRAWDDFLGFYSVQYTVTTSTRRDSGGGSGGRDRAEESSRETLGESANLPSR